MELDQVSTQELYAEMIRRLGEDPERDGLRRTPDRMEKSMAFLTRGYGQTVEQVLHGALFDVEYDEMVIVKDIEFYSLCEHHVLPFYGKAHVAYVPTNKVIGLSKVARLVDVFARRLQVQERLTRQVAEAIEDAIHPQGVGVILEAQHLCMMMRGVEKTALGDGNLGDAGGVQDADADAQRILVAGAPLNGLLVLDKPAGMTSHDVVALVRRATGEKSIGHLGTLDPMATGVLPLLLGKYTRLAQFFGQADKSYTGEIRFGWATDSFDADGVQVGEARDLQLDLGELEKLAAHFSGEMNQMPPIFSAKKLGGVPAHKLARAGLPVPVKPARITIREFVVTALAADRAEFRMTVSAGGYVRSVAHETGADGGLWGAPFGAAASAGGRVHARPGDYGGGAEGGDHGGYAAASAYAAAGDAGGDDG